MKCILSAKWVLTSCTCDDLVATKRSSNTDVWCLMSTHRKICSCVLHCSVRSCSFLLSEFVSCIFNGVVQCYLSWSDMSHRLVHWNSSELSDRFDISSHAACTVASVNVNDSYDLMSKLLLSTLILSKYMSHLIVCVCPAFLSYTSMLHFSPLWYHIYLQTEVTL